MYIGGTPLFDEMTGIKTERYDYLLAKFPGKPWEVQLSKNEEELKKIDGWLDSEDLNMFGDPKGAFTLCRFMAL